MSWIGSFGDKRSNYVYYLKLWYFAILNWKITLLSIEFTEISIFINHTQRYINNKI